MYLDIDRDCFLQINGQYIHYASNGGLLPKQFVQKQKELYKLVKEAPDVYGDNDLIVNPHLRSILDIEHLKEQYEIVLSALKKETNGDVIESYIENVYVPAFKKYARKGFISYDGDGKDNAFWVVRPSAEIRNVDLEEDKIPNIEIGEINIYNESPFPLIPLYNSAKDLK